MKEEDMKDLTPSEVDKIERINKSITDRLDAEARLESQKKIRILFERAPEKALPFIVYVIYMGAMALTVLLKLLDYTGAQLYIGGILLFVVMVAPLFVLPMESWKGLFKYLRSKLKGSE
jgi:hypothetical protein